MGYHKQGAGMSWVILFAFVLLFCFFGQKVNAQMVKSEILNHTYLDPFPTEEKVRSDLKPGMQREAVIQLFGEPYLRDVFQGDAATDNYERKPDFSRPTSGQNRFSGFKVYYESNRVTKWLPIYAGDLILPVANTIPLDSESGSALGNPNIGFYEVEKYPINGAHQTDTPILKEPGFIRSEPDFAGTNVESVELRGPAKADSPEKEYVINVKLKKEYAKDFEVFSRGHTAKKILMTINGYPAWAGIITSPITDGNFQIRTPDEKRAREVMADFRRSTKR